MSSDLSHVYSVGPFTIREDGERFFIAPTGTTKWSKPYKTLRHACTAIARKLEGEYVARRTQREDFYRRYGKRRAA